MCDYYIILFCSACGKRQQCNSAFSHAFQMCLTLFSYSSHICRCIILIPCNIVPQAWKFCLIGNYPLATSSNKRQDPRPKCVSVLQNSFHPDPTIPPNGIEANTYHGIADAGGKHLRYIVGRSNHQSDLVWPHAGQRCPRSRNLRSQRLWPEYFSKLQFERVWPHAGQRCPRRRKLSQRPGSEELPKRWSALIWPHAGKSCIAPEGGICWVSRKGQNRYQSTTLYETGHTLARGDPGGQICAEREPPKPEWLSNQRSERIPPYAGQRKPQMDEVLPGSCQG